MEMDEEMDQETGQEKKNKKLIWIVVAILVIGLIIYFISSSKKSSTSDIDKTPNIAVDYSGKTDGRKPIINVVSVDDENGLISSNYFDFRVNSAVKTKRLYYEVILSPSSTNTINTSHLNTYLTDQSNNVITGLIRYDDLPNSEKVNGKIIYRGVVNPNSDNTIKRDTKEFRLRIWQSSDSNDTLSGAFEFDISVNSYFVDENFVNNDLVIYASAPLSLSATEGNILTNESATAKIITVGDGALSCKSSDDSLATCSISGKTLTVNGLKPGTATITVDQAAGKIYSKSNTVSYNVTITSAKAAAKLSLSSDSGAVYLGMFTATEIYTNGDGALSCSSSNEKVVACSIENKILKIKGVGSGTASVIISQKEGESTLAPGDVIYTVTEVKTPASSTISAVSGLETTPYGKIYVGKSPNNYIWFNNEQWRILGVYGDSLKIVRNKPYTTSQVYNSKNSAESKWDGSAIQKYLYDNYNSIIADENSRKMVLEDAIWSAGTAGPRLTAEKAYNSAIKTEWTGKIGLITSYEYQYAAPKSCWTKTGVDYESSCGTNDWLYNVIGKSGSDGGWTMNPDTSKGRALRVHQQKFIDDNPFDSSIAVSPVVYLKKEISITGGTGKSGQEGSYKLGY